MATLIVSRDMTETNFPVDAEGRTYHVGIKHGDVANKILLVGDPERAERVAKCFDNQDFTRIETTRGFLTLTGTKDGKRVTIMAMGMGLAMMDFAVREIRHVTKGPLTIIRLGTCGTPHSETVAKTVVVARKSFAVLTNYDAYLGATTETKKHFDFKLPLEPDTTLHQQLVEKLKTASKGLYPVSEASDSTADSFYGSQGRTDPNFDDHNSQLVEKILQHDPDTRSLQMETYHLFHLARLSQKIHAAACAIVLAERSTGVFLSNADKHEIESNAGNACLELLAQSP